jgi:hypothetical protein
MLQGMAQVIKDGDAEEVMKQIAALRDQLEGKSRTAVDIARSIHPRTGGVVLNQEGRQLRRLSAILV